LRIDDLEEQVRLTVLGPVDSDIPPGFPGGEGGLRAGDRGRGACGRRGSDIRGGHGDFASSSGGECYSGDTPSGSRYGGSETLEQDLDSDS